MLHLPQTSFQSKQTKWFLLFIFVKEIRRVFLMHLIHQLSVFVCIFFMCLDQSPLNSRPYRILRCVRPSLCSSIKKTIEFVSQQKRHCFVNIALLLFVVKKKAFSISNSDVRQFCCPCLKPRRVSPAAGSGRGGTQPLCKQESPNDRYVRMTNRCVAYHKILMSMTLVIESFSQYLSE